MAKSNHISLRPSDKEQGGGSFGIPAGAEFLVTDAEFTTWEDAGERAYGGTTGREKDDPALKMVVEITDVEEPRTIHLGLGKQARLVPSRDGQFLDPAEGSSAKGLPDGANGTIFLESLTDKQAHGKKAMPEDMLDNGIGKALIGLKAIAGAKKVERNFDDDGRKRANRPVLVVEEILELPDGSGKVGKSSSKAKGKSKKDEDEDEDRPARGKSSKSKDDDDEDEKPARSSKKKGDDDDEDIEEVIEAAVVDLLDNNPKYRKGIPEGDIVRAVYSALKKRDDVDKIIDDYVNDKKWVTSSKRPWKLDDGVFVSA